MTPPQKNDCDYCRRDGLQILPLRYAVAYGKTDKEAEALNVLAPLIGSLGQGVTQIPLAKSRYTTRLLRSGYLYPLINRNGSLRCEIVYAVSAEGFLRPTAWNEPKANDHQPCQPGNCGINASTISIKDAKSVKEVHILYSPVPLSPKVLGDYVKTLHTKAQRFSPKDWIEGQRAQKHTLAASEWRKTIAEFAALDHPELLQCFKAHEVLFPFYGDTGRIPAANELDRQRSRLEGLEKKFLCDKNTMTVVLHDTLGIAQELNQARNQVFNAPTERLLAEPFTLNQPKMYWGFDAEADPDVATLEKQRKEALDVALQSSPVMVGIGGPVDPYGQQGIAAYYDGKRKRLIQDKQAALKKKPSPTALIQNREAAQVALILGSLRQEWDARRLQMASSYFDTQYEMVRHRDKVIIQTDPGWEKKVGKPGYYRGRIYSGEAQWNYHVKSLKSRSQAMQQNRAQANNDDWHTDYAPLYNDKALTAFQERTDAALEQGRRAAADKARDHLAWLQSPTLAGALAWYDTTDPSWGVAYTSTVGELLSGVVGTGEGLALLQKWATAEKIEPDNLLLRALVFAQQDAEKSLVYKAPAAADPGIAWASVQKNVATVVKHIDKAHAVVDAFETGKDFSKAFVGTASYSWLTAVHMNGYFKLMENLYSVLAKIPTEKLSLPFVSAIVSNLGSNALMKLRLDQWLGAVNKAGLLKAGPLAVPGPHTLAADFDKLKLDTKTKWASLRIGTILALLEVWNLKNKMDKLPAGSEKVRMEFGAALLVTSAAGLELCGRGVVLVGARGGALTEATAKVAVSGLKLVSGFLGAVAGLVGILLDGDSRDKAALKQQNTLVFFYKMRIGFQYGIVGVTSLSTYAASAPFLKHIVEHTTSQLIKRSATWGLLGAEWVAAGRTFLLIGGFWLAAGTVAVTIVIAYIEDDALQAYLRRSIWRLPESNEPPFENLKKESEALGLAFQGVA